MATTLSRPRRHYRHLRTIAAAAALAALPACDPTPDAAPDAWSGRSMPLAAPSDHCQVIATACDKVTVTCSGLPPSAVIQSERADRQHADTSGAAQWVFEPPYLGYREQLTICPPDVPFPGPDRDAGPSPDCIYATLAETSSSICWTADDADGLPATIPDNRPGGILRQFNFSATGNRPGDEVIVTADVEIRHTWRGDLKLSAVSPSGEVVVLRDRSGGSADDLVGRFGAITTAPRKGVWGLRVEDLAAQDVGRLIKARLSTYALCHDLARCLAESRYCAATAYGRTERAIPDNDANGTWSAFTLLDDYRRPTDPGVYIGHVRVELDIRHNSPSEVVAELICPDGSVIDLPNPVGNGVVRTYHLGHCAGGDASGLWRLRVQDTRPTNVGVLRHWSVRNRPACR